MKNARLSILSNTKNCFPCLSVSLVVLCLFLLGGGSRVLAQNSSDRGTPVESKPGPSTVSTYARDKIETVNLANGNFSLSIPLAVVGGSRGAASYPIVLSYNSKVWTAERDREPVYTQNGAAGTPYNHYSAMYDKPVLGEPGLARLGGGWTIRVAPGIKMLTSGIDPVPTTQCHNMTDDIPDCGSKYALTKMWLTLPDGSQVELRDSATEGAPALTTVITDGYHQLTDRDRGRVWHSFDGSGVTFVRDPNYPVSSGADLYFPSGWVFMPDGTRMHMDDGAASKIIDRNGNFILVGVGGVYTDELGRQTLLQSTANTLTVTVKGYMGTADRSLTVNLGVIGDAANLRADFQSLPRPFTTGDAFHDALGNDYDHTIQGPHTDLFIQSDGSHNFYGMEGLDVGTMTAVTSLNLLDGRSLHFRYNQYGEVAEIVYPGGGVSQVDYFGGVTSVCEVSAPIHMTLNRKVSQRRTLTDGANVDTTWLYSPVSAVVDGITYPAVNVEVHQGAAIGTLLASEKHIFLKINAEYRPCGGTHTGTGNEKWDNAKEFRTETQTGTGTTVTIRNWQQKASVVWANDVGLSYNNYVVYVGQDQPPNDPRVVSEDTILENGKMKRVEYGYDDFNNVVSVKEYDFGTAGSPGTLARQTFRTYGDHRCQLWHQQERLLLFQS